MNSILSPVSLTSYFSPEGLEVIQADLYFYTSGSLDPIAVYKDSLLSLVHAQPVQTGGSGRVPPIFIGERPTYRVRVLDSVHGTVLEDIDDLPGAEPDPASVPPPVAVDITGIPVTGDYMLSFNAGGSRVGFVRANGRTIGAGGAPYVASGATERANNDTQALFLHLWQQDSTGQRLLVSPGGRGPTASGDFAAGKQIALPDYRNRMLTGIDNMGSGQVKNLFFWGLNDSVWKGQVPGDSGGEGAHILVTAEIGTHTHNVTDPGHTHGITQVAHTHLVNEWPHTHPTTTGTVTSAYELLATAEPGISGGYSGRAQVTGIAGDAITAVSTNLTILDANAQITINNGTTGFSVQNNIGGGGPHNNLPPYCTLCVYIRL